MPARFPMTLNLLYALEPVTAALCLICAVAFSGDVGARHPCGVGSVATGGPPAGWQSRKNTLGL